MRQLLMILIFVSILTASAMGEDRKITWRRSTAMEEELVLFRTNHAVNLQTSLTLSSNTWQFQIYHRFFPPLSDGYEAMYGLDGPANIRIGLAYAVTDNLMLTLARSNFLDNLDFRAKYKLFGVRHEHLPLLVGVQGGLAWSTGVLDRDNTDDRNLQYYGQVIINTMVSDLLGIGLVPSYLYNAEVLTDDFEDLLALGTYFQFYFARRFSLIAEWTPVVTGFKREHNSYALSLEMRTAGHFFKIIVTNSMGLNPSQYLPGGDYPLKLKELRLGFNITRLLVF